MPTRMEGAPTPPGAPPASWGPWPSPSAAPARRLPPPQAPCLVGPGGLARGRRPPTPSPIQPIIASGEHHGHYCSAPLLLSRARATPSPGPGAAPAVHVAIGLVLQVPFLSLLSDSLLAVCYVPGPDSFVVPQLDRGAVTCSSCSSLVITLAA